MSGDDPIRGFSERIVTRARWLAAALLSVPLFAVAYQYCLFLLSDGFTITAAFEQIHRDWALIAFVVAVPSVVLAFFRELLVHTLIDKIVGTRQRVDIKISKLMSSLATQSGYDHPDRITSNRREALRWFYFYVNPPSALRDYAFEIWEGYYVGLYISLFSVLSLVGCLFLMYFIPVPIFFPSLPVVIFLCAWGVRHWATIPKILDLPAQQIQEIKADGAVLLEARRRFGV